MPNPPQDLQRLAASLRIACRQQKDASVLIAKLQLEFARATRIRMPELTQRQSVRLIISYVAAAYGISVEEMMGRGRRHPQAEARQMAMALCRAATPMSFNAIGDFFHKDHGTVIHAVEVITGRRTCYPQMNDVYLQILQLVTQEASIIPSQN